MNNNFLYLSEKLSTLIYNLLIGTGTAKQRLTANLNLFLRAFSLDFPKELEKSKKKIINQLTKFPEIKMGEEIISNAYENTLSKIKNETASSIIGDIYELHRELNSLKKEKL